MAEEHSLMYVPEALEEQILVRLPVKSIVRFKSVCKRWHSLFRLKAFEELYFGLHDKEAFIPRRKDLRLNSPGRRSTTSVIGPLSNGIYALTSYLLSQLRDVLNQTLKIALFNPATRRVKFASSFPEKYIRLLSGIKPYDCSVSCGIDDDYRVVVLISYEDFRSCGRCFLVFLYTWRTGEWEKLPRENQMFERTSDVLNDMMACSQKLFNGCWHWMTTGWDEDFSEYFEVLFFDFERKSLGLIRGPPCKITSHADLFVLRDYLAAILVDCRDRRLEIWRKTTTWTNVYRVNISQSFLAHEAILHSVDYYQVVEEEEEPASIKIKRLVFVEREEQITFDEQGHMMKEFIDTSNPKVSLSVGGISKFTPTFEHLPL